MAISLIAAATRQTNSEAGADVLGRIIVIIALLAIFLAPFGLLKTHGPMQIAAAAAHADHGHRLDPGATVPVAAGYQHDAADHEHQLQAVLIREDSEAFDTSGLSFRPAMQITSALNPVRPRRPPKQSTV